MANRLRYDCARSCDTNPKRERGLFETSATCLPSLTLRVGVPELTRSRCRRAGFTLLELLLVLGLIVLLAAWIAPQWQGQLARQRLEAAANEIRLVWQEARLHAIEDGISYQFEFVPGTGHYRVLPADSADREPPEGRQVESVDLEEPEDAPAWRLDATLPTDVRFAARSDEVDWVTRPTAEANEESPGNESLSESDWRVCIAFHPQGTANDASLVIASPHVPTRRQVTLRGLTGHVRVEDVPQDHEPSE